VATEETGRAPDPAVAAVWDDLKPYAAAASLVQVLGTPAELVVPVVRRLLGRDGVSLVPGLVSAGNGLVGLAVVRFVRGRPDLSEEPVPRALLMAALGHLLLSPLAGAWGERAVVLRGRSPLWGGVVLPSGVVPIAVMATAVVRARRARRRAAPAVPVR